MNFRKISSSKYLDLKFVALTPVSLKNKKEIRNLSI